MLWDAMLFVILDYMLKPKHGSISIVLHDIRSTHNVGAILRTADGIGIKQVYMTGYTPYPRQEKNDDRLPHIAQRNHAAIRKTALGAESQVDWKYEKSLENLMAKLKTENKTLYALEQSAGAKPLHSMKMQSGEHIVLIAGNEVEGLPMPVIQLSDEAIEIPMLGQKESFNVSVAVGMALHWFRYAQ